jgi:tetratricopeptide (TPR) repeat protein
VKPKKNLNTEMPKVLKPYTIIPSSLYVHRDADRQVKNIIKDMGRPGYVLVSRQMGKTNLILNAKRELESSDDIFVYIDLSNPFPSAKDCFENIIDTAIETNFEKLEEAQKIIQERREGLKDTPAHKQHTNELRILLKAIKGKLVIILDEIDALTKTSYSDQIFAQIRSIYFSRVNFEELSRLTYLLSGVIEPTEIIKDPKISPFNIGQKIFLNDFSNEEFHKFLLNAEIKINEESIERIFYWTNGNPRMTWDLCSEIENIAKQETVNSVLVDKIVTEMYLTEFDKPPIDNIRELVKKDREIRNAIIDIELKKTKSISDKLKSKLYLSGIINYEDNNVQIKNNIIRESLNASWIRSLELEEKGLFESALTLIDKGKNKEALEVFEKFLEGSDFDENQKNLCYYNMAYALVQLGNFKKALQYSELTDFDKEDEIKWYYRSKIQKGLIQYYLGNIDKSLEYFKEIIDSGRKDELFVRALLNYGSISLKDEKGRYKDEATRIFEDIISEKGFEKAKIKNDLMSELKSIAHYNLAQLLIGNNEQSKAKENLYLALNNPKENTKPTIILSLLEVEENIDEKKDLIKQIADLIISDKIIPTESDPEKPLDFTFNQFQEVLITAYIIDKKNIFDQLRSKFYLLGNKPEYSHLYDLAVFALQSKLFDTGIELLNDIYSIRETLDEKTFYNCAKLLAYFNPHKNSLVKPIEYLLLFEKERVEKIDYIDFEIIANVVFQYTSKQNFKEALKYVTLIHSMYDEVDTDILINFLVIYHLELNIYLHTRNTAKAIEKAKDVIVFANKEELKHQRSNLLGDTGLEIIKQNAENIINPKVRQVAPIRVEKTFGRNDIVKVRYKDGTIVEKKFKKVENEIRKGECFIISES